jgi:hypothetical protein
MIVKTTAVTSDCYTNCLLNGDIINKNREYGVYIASMTEEMTCEDFCNSLNKKTLP